jgi:ankyrin repeat protein
MVRLLLDRGADPRWPDADAPGGAALYAAARAGNRELVELLLTHGADPNAHVVASGNAVFASGRFPEIRALLEAHGGTLDPYDLVWLDEDDEVMRRIAADPESAYAGCGGVYTAVVTRGKRDLLMRLLDAGVRVPRRPNGCRSYLLEDADMLRLLLERGGLDPDYTDERGSTLLHALCGRHVCGLTMSQRTECAGILLDACATISARDKNGVTPLELARRNDLPEMVEFLSARSAISGH